MSVVEFDGSEKHVHTVYTNAGTRESTVLTAKGLYKLILRSRKPFAPDLQNWVCDVTFVQGAFDPVGQDDQMRNFYLVSLSYAFAIVYHSILLYS